MSTIRAFIAIELSDEAKAVLTDAVDALAAQVPDGAVKWVQPNQMHLTLRFLGNTPLEKLEDLAKTLDGVAARHEPFVFSLDALGCFPNERRPRVIWVGVKGDMERAKALRNDLEDALQPLGWEPESRPFQPHLTLGRVKDQASSIELPWGKGVAPAETVADGIVLFESQLSPSGARYVVRYVSRLGGKASESRQEAA
ncbi:MAG TPA: RNA 2',3'-cyclic phosphodiesterase [Candidatus Binatia bacterium]|jgi:2'-5' RNA ligase|nr:RNA 2',3'-cyclic phosphodiesterase [Candidatus Binatia bacterium]